MPHVLLFLCGIKIIKTRLNSLIIHICQTLKLKEGVVFFHYCSITKCNLKKKKKPLEAITVARQQFKGILLSWTFGIFMNIWHHIWWSQSKDLHDALGARTLYSFLILAVKIHHWCCCLNHHTVWTHPSADADCGCGCKDHLLDL